MRVASSVPCRRAVDAVGSRRPGRGWAPPGRLSPSARTEPPRTATARRTVRSPSDVVSGLGCDQVRHRRSPACPPRTSPVRARGCLVPDPPRTAGTTSTPRRRTFRPRKAGAQPSRTQTLGRSRRPDAAPHPASAGRDRRPRPVGESRRLPAAVVRFHIRRPGRWPPVAHGAATAPAPHDEPARTARTGEHCRHTTPPRTRTGTLLSTSQPRPAIQPGHRARSGPEPEGHHRRIPQRGPSSELVTLL